MSLLEKHPQNIVYSFNGILTFVPTRGRVRVNWINVRIVALFTIRFVRAIRLCCQYMVAVE